MNAKPDSRVIYVLSFINIINAHFWLLLMLYRSEDNLAEVNVEQIKDTIDFSHYIVNTNTDEDIIDIFDTTLGVPRWVVYKYTVPYRDYVCLSLYNSNFEICPVYIYQRNYSLSWSQYFNIQSFNTAFYLNIFCFLNIRYITFTLYDSGWQWNVQYRKNNAFKLQAPW